MTRPPIGRLQTNRARPPEVCHGARARRGRATRGETLLPLYATFARAGPMVAEGAQTVARVSRRASLLSAWSVATCNSIAASSVAVLPLWTRPA